MTQYKGYNFTGYFRANQWWPGRLGSMVGTLPDGRNVNANHIRWQQLCWSGGDGLDWPGFWSPMKDQVPPTDAAWEQYIGWNMNWFHHQVGRTVHILQNEFGPLCRSLGLQVILDAHWYYGFTPRLSAPNSGARLFWSVGDYINPRDQDYLDYYWWYMATHLRGADWLLGYDIVNEPNVPQRHPEYWHGLVRRVSNTIRSIDANRPIIVETRLDNILNLLNDDVNLLYGGHNVWASGHFYGNAGGPGFPPNGYYGYGRIYDRNWLRSVLLPIKRWSQTHGKQIYVGEIGVNTGILNTIPDGRGGQRLVLGGQYPWKDEWIADAISICNEFGFHYALWEGEQPGMKLFPL